MYGAKRILVAGFVLLHLRMSAGSPVDGGWGSWLSWECTVTCGAGQDVRRRLCDNSASSGGGLDCVGDSREMGSSCTLAACPADGEWSSWSAWICSTTCGDGMLTRDRACDSPAPAHGGAACAGDAKESGPVCNEGPCPVDGAWSSWDTWVCNVDCGEGRLVRERTCDNPVPAHGGAGCPGAAEETSNACSQDPCSAELGEPCEPSAGETACRDRYAVCSHLDDLAENYCVCPLGTVRLYNGTDSCRLVLDSSDDPDCGTCIENNGQCYADDTDKDEMGGCLCPATRVTVDEPCDTELDLSVDCGAKDMSVCYNRQENEDYVGIFDLLKKKMAKIYTIGHLWNESCHFTKNDEAFCLTLTLDDTDCGLIAENSPDGLIYSVRARLQKSETPSDEDLNFRISCTFNKQTDVSSADIAIVGDEYEDAMERGSRADAVVRLEVTNADGEDLIDTFLVLGDPLMIEISLEDDDDVYTSLRAEVCMITDTADATSVPAQTVYFLQDGCPAGPLQDYVTIYHGFDENKQEIFLESTPKFLDDQTGLIYVHCAVRTCILPGECTPRICDTLERGRRTASGHHVSEEMLYWFHQPGLAHKVAAIRIRETEKPRAASRNSEGLDASTLQDMPMWVLAVPLVLAAVVIVAAGTIFHRIRRQQPANIP